MHHIDYFLDNITVFESIYKKLKMLPITNYNYDEYLYLLLDSYLDVQITFNNFMALLSKLKINGSYIRKPHLINKWFIDHEYVYVKKNNDYIISLNLFAYDFNKLEKFINMNNDEMNKLKNLKYITNMSYILQIINNIRYTENTHNSKYIFNFQEITDEFYEHFQMYFTQYFFDERLVYSASQFIKQIFCDYKITNPVGNDIFNKENTELFMNSLDENIHKYETNIKHSGFLTIVLNGTIRRNTSKINFNKKNVVTPSHIYHTQPWTIGNRIKSNQYFIGIHYFCRAVLVIVDDNTIINCHLVKKKYVLRDTFIMCNYNKFNQINKFIVNGNIYNKLKFNKELHDKIKNNFIRLYFYHKNYELLTLDEILYNEYKPINYNISFPNKYVFVGDFNIKFNELCKATINCYKLYDYLINELNNDLTVFDIINEFKNFNFYYRYNDIDYIITNDDRITFSNQIYYKTVLNKNKNLFHVTSDNKFTKSHIDFNSKYFLSNGNVIYDYFFDKYLC